jgi:acetyltransferase-like isoleucine patch superfamily enzyme
MKRLHLKILKVRGMKVGKGSSVGYLHCLWPGRVIAGFGVIIEDRVGIKINHPFAEGYALEIGNNVFIGEDCNFNITSGVSIGDGTWIAAGTLIADVSHEIARDRCIGDQQVTSKRISIGQDVWIGAGSIILMGVTLHDGAVVGAGSIVNKSIPAYEVWAGSPARWIKDRA